MAIEFITIPMYDPATDRLLNQDEGPQASLFQLDALGVPQYNNKHKQHLQYGEAETGFTPDIPVYTITETIDGRLHVLDNSGNPTGSKTRRTERRKLQIDTVKNIEKYFINDVLQAYVPTKPDSTKEIILEKTAIIGYPDTAIDRLFFEVRNIIK